MQNWLQLISEVLSSNHLMYIAWGWLLLTLHEYLVMLASCFTSAFRPFTLKRDFITIWQRLSQRSCRLYVMKEIIILRWFLCIVVDILFHSWQMNLTESWFFMVVLVENLHVVSNDPGNEWSFCIDRAADDDFSYIGSRVVPDNMIYIQHDEWRPKWRCS